MGVDREKCNGSLPFWMGVTRVRFSNAKTISVARNGCVTPIPENLGCISGSGNMCAAEAGALPELEYSADLSCCYPSQGNRALFGTRKLFQG